MIPTQFMSGHSNRRDPKVLYATVKGSIVTTTTRGLGERLVQYTSSVASLVEDICRAEGETIRGKEDGVKPAVGDAALARRQAAMAVAVRGVIFTWMLLVIRKDKDRLLLFIL